MSEELTFKQKLKNYARLLAEYGLNVQPNEFVQIEFEQGAEEVAVLVAEEAYALGARHVHLSYVNPRLTYAQLTRKTGEDRFFVPVHERVRCDSLVDSGGCGLYLVTNSEPRLFDTISSLSIQHENAVKAAWSRFYKEGINKGAVSWCVACPPSMKEARLVYPHLDYISDEEVRDAYWEAIFRMTFADTEDCLERWRRLSTQLKVRRDKLDALNARAIHFVGPGTDLSVGLTERSVWCDGGGMTSRGKRFLANVPSFEVFTTPDWRLVNGFVRMTRPVYVSGVLVEGLELVFRDGVLVSGKASKNWDAYESYINSDEGARRLGEVALVGTDSPIRRESDHLRETLYTENAACHIATGDGYAEGIRDGQKMNEDALRGLGWNSSVTHLDVMISDEHTDVSAVLESGDEVLILKDGAWMAEFA